MHSRRSLIVALALAALLSVVLVAACSAAPGAVGSKARPTLVPPSPMLTSPRTAVYSYLLWISYSYRVLNSDASSPTQGPDEGVRVDSYVELNREKDRAIEQTLTALDIRSVTTKGETSTVVARENWLYRYITVSTDTYASPQYGASFDSTYTVVLDPKTRTWRVFQVQATPREKLK